MLMPYRDSNTPEVRVSSQAIRSQPARVSSPRKVMSPRLPIGVATRYNPHESEGAERVACRRVKVRVVLSDNCYHQKFRLQSFVRQIFVNHNKR